MKNHQNCAHIPCDSGTVPDAKNPAEFNFEVFEAARGPQNALRGSNLMPQAVGLHHDARASSKFAASMFSHLRRPPWIHSSSSGAPAQKKLAPQGACSALKVSRHNFVRKMHVWRALLMSARSRDVHGVSVKFCCVCGHGCAVALPDASATIFFFFFSQWQNADGCARPQATQLEVHISMSLENSHFHGVDGLPHWKVSKCGWQFAFQTNVCAANCENKLVMNFASWRASF